ncbi:MAG: type II secretion system F family protein [Coriobacteriales bacterium]
MTALLAVVLAGACGVLLAPLAFDSLEHMARAGESRARLRGDGLASRARFGAPRSEARGVGSKHMGSAGEPKGGVANSIKAISIQLIEGGVPALSGISRRLLGIEPVRRHMEELNGYARRRGASCTPKSVCEACLVVLVVISILLFLLSGSVIAVVAVLVLLVAAVRFAVSSDESGNRNKVQETMPEALREIGVCYSSGLTLLQSLEQVSSDIPDPLGGLLEAAVFDLKAGKSVPEAMETMREISRSDAVDFLSVTLEIHQKTGGPLQPLLERSADAVEKSLELRRFLRVNTAQARLSAKIVTLLPFGIFAVMALVNDSYAASFLESGAGIAMLLVACAMDLAGVLLIRKILGVGNKR